MSKHSITKETLANLRSEFENLTNVERIKIIEEIKVARDNGDLSENADYESALNQQKFIEGRILEIKDILDNHEIIDDDSDRDTDVVKIGSRVTIEELDDGSKHEYEILGSVDNNPSMGKISNECPLARSILGRKAGETVEVESILNSYKIKILKIS